MAEEVKIVIKLVDKTGSGAKSVKKQLEGLGLAGKKAGGKDGVGSLSKGLGNLGGVAKGLATGALVAVAAGVAAVGAAAVVATVSIAKFAAAGVSMATDLEAQLSGIESLLAGVIPNADDLTMAMEDVGDAILKLGLDPALKVNSQEAAAAIEMLVRNGLDMTEILGEVGDLSDSAARAVVLLSNATGGNFAQSADIATDVMALWGDELGNINDAVDGITSVVTNSKFSIDDFALALAQGGGVAASVGVEFDDFNTAISAMSPLFASGSDAGTSFKVLLTTLSGKSGPAIDALAELGIVTEDGTNRFFDAEGQLKSMSDVSKILADSVKGLSEEQRINAFSTAFGTDAMRAAFGLVKAGTVDIETGATAFETLAESMKQTDAAKSAEIRMDNLAGSMEILKGVIDTIKIQVGQALIPALTGLARVVTGFVDQNGPMLVSLFETLGVWLGDNLPTAADSLISTFDSIISLFTRFSGGIGTARGVWENSWNAISEVFMGFWNRAKPTLDEIGEIFREIFGVVSEMLGDVFQGVLAESGDAAASWGDIIQAAFEVALSALKLFAKILQITLTGLRKFWDRHGKSVVKIVRNLWKIIRKVVETQIKVLLKIISAVLKVLQGDWEGAWIDIKDALEIAWEGMKEIVTAVIAIVRTVIEAWLKETIRKFNEFVIGFINIAKDWWDDLRQGLADLISDWIKAVVGWLADTLSDFAGFIADWLSDLGSWASDTLSELAGMISDWLSEIASWISDTLSDFAGFIADWLSDLGSWASDTLSELASFISDWLAAITQWISDSVTALDNFISDFTADVSGWFFDVLAQLSAFVTDFLTSVTGWLTGPDSIVSRFTAFVTDFLTSVTGWLTGPDSVVSRFTAFVTDFLTSVTGWLTGPDSVVSRFTAFVTGFLTSFNTSWLAELVVSFGTFITNFLVSVGNWVDGIRQKIVDTWVEVVAALSGSLTSLLNLITPGAPGSVWGTITSIGSGIVSGIVTGFQGVLTFVSDVGSKLRDWLRDLMDNVVNAAKGVGSGIVDNIKAGFQGVQTFATNVGSTLRGWLNDLTNGVVNTAQTVGAVIVSSIKNGFQGVQTFVDNVGSTLRGWLNDLANGVVNTAQTVGAVIVDNIKNGFQNVQTFVDNVRSTLGGWLISISSNSGALARTVGSGIVNNIKNGFQNVQTFVDNVGSTLRGWISDLASGIVNAARTVGTEIVDNIKLGFTGAQNSFNLLRDVIKDWILSWFSPIPEAQIAGLEIVDNIITGFLAQRGNFNRVLVTNLANWIANATQGVGGVPISLSPEMFLGQQLGAAAANLGISSLASPGLTLPSVGVSTGVTAPTPSATAGGDTFSPVFHTIITNDISAAEFELRVEEALLSLSRRRGAI
jgi:TP901 family phage tail tape measure protein